MRRINGSGIIDTVHNPPLARIVSGKRKLGKFFIVSSIASEHILKEPQILDCRTDISFGIKHVIRRESSCCTWHHLHQAHCPTLGMRLDMELRFLPDKCSKH